jgi:hypothetical protein
MFDCDRGLGEAAQEREHRRKKDQPPNARFKSGDFHDSERQ